MSEGKCEGGSERDPREVCPDCGGTLQQRAYEYACENVGDGCSFVRKGFMADRSVDTATKEEP